MERYKGIKIKRYKSILKEAFRSQDVSRAMELTAKIIGNRLGKPISLSSLTSNFQNSDGLFFGINGIVGGSEAIRFNWESSGNSSQITSISYWYKPSKNPDIIIDTDNFNIVKIIDTIVEAIKNRVPTEYMVFAERVEPATKGKVSIAVSQSINAWKQDSDLQTSDLENRRMTALYNDYTFWYDNLSDDESVKYKYVSKSTFLKYMQTAMKAQGITNKFARTITVRKASKEIQKVSRVNSEKFKTAILEMSLEDKMNMVAMVTDAVIKGYKISTLITGTAGIGKTTTVLAQLKAKGQAYKYFSGGIKNARAFYQILYDNNDPNLIIVFDDINNILRNKESVELLRVATSDLKKRHITYADTKINSSNRKYKPELVFESKIIIITNLPKSKIDRAIISRTGAIELIISKQEIADNIRINLEQAPPPIPIDWKIEVWDFLTDELGLKNITHLDFRLFKSACIWRAASEGSPSWKKFVYAEMG